MSQRINYGVTIRKDGELLIIPKRPEKGEALSKVKEPLRRAQTIFNANGDTQEWNDFQKEAVEQIAPSAALGLQPLAEKV